MAKASKVGMKFKVGDRVRLTGRTYDKFVGGETGTVVGYHPEWKVNTIVEWDNGLSDPGFAESNLDILSWKEDPRTPDLKEILDYYSAVTGE